MAGPPGFEPGTFGSLPVIDPQTQVKSPTLYQAELRAQFSSLFVISKGFIWLSTWVYPVVV